MSSSNHARVSSRADRRTTAENGTQPRAPADHQGRSSRTERQDPRRTQSPPSHHASSHKRGPSGSQRTNRAVEERRTERTHITTRETVTRTRSPERRSAPSQQSERHRPPELLRTNSNDPRSRSSQPDTPQCRQCAVLWQLEGLTFNSTMASRSVPSTPYFGASSFTNFYTTARIPSAAIITADTIVRLISRGTRGGNSVGSVNGVDGLRRTIYTLLKELQSFR